MDKSPQTEHGPLAALKGEFAARPLDSCAKAAGLLLLIAGVVGSVFLNWDKAWKLMSIWLLIALLLLTIGAPILRLFRRGLRPGGGSSGDILWAMMVLALIPYWHITELASAEQRHVEVTGRLVALLQEVAKATVGGSETDKLVLERIGRSVEDTPRAETPIDLAWRRAESISRSLLFTIAGGLSTLSLFLHFLAILQRLESGSDRATEAGQSRPPD